MGVWQAGGRFYLNHGSFTGTDTQNVLRFWESADLWTWTYIGEKADLTPDPRWYDPNSRFDCMDVISAEENGRTSYHGIASGPGGWLRSDDGVHWEGRPPSKFEFGSLQPAGDYPFEIAGWFPIGGKVNLLDSRPSYAGNRGYCLYTLVGDSVNGPFWPDAAAYRLSGHSGRSVNFQAKPCRTGQELLASSYMYDGWGYRMGDVLLPPLKRFSLGSDGHLRLSYWQQNEALKGNRLDADLTRLRVYPGLGQSPAGSVDVEITGSRLEVTVAPSTDGSIPIGRLWPCFSCRKSFPERTRNRPRRR